MASLTKPCGISAADLESFTALLQSSTRILALLGAGLSASSGLPTFRGAGGLWRNHDALTLATPEAFNADPALVWQFYSYRRHMALKAKPNAAHFALAELARRRDGFVTLSQNVDGLSPRANHPASQLHLLHGSLFDLKCTSFYCSYHERDNFTDPIVPALAIPTRKRTPADGPAAGHQDTIEIDITNGENDVPAINIRDLPHCPECKEGLLRPGVVWFGERLPEKTIDVVDDWITESRKIDLILVIGTSARVYPAAAYIDQARAKGARVAVINMDPLDAPKVSGGLAKDDWFFQGDAATIVPELLKSVVGTVQP